MDAALLKKGMCTNNLSDQMTTRSTITLNAHKAQLLEACRLRATVTHRGRTYAPKRASFAKRIGCTMAAYRMYLSGMAAVPADVEAEARRLGRIEVVGDYEFINT